jgi:YHS domain-containing protein
VYGLALVAADAAAFGIETAGAARAEVRAGIEEKEGDPVAIDNLRDPICGMTVSDVPASRTCKYEGKTIGFCSTACLAAWNKLNAEQKDQKIAAAMAAGDRVDSEKDYQPLPSPGKKVPLGAHHYFVYGFAQAPKLGTAIMRVEVFTLDGRPDTTFVVKGDADMPSMRGAHSTGARKFALSARGTYLLPIPLVMPGDWEVRFTFEREGKTVLRAAYLFDL